MTEQEQTVILEAREILARYFNQNPLLTSWQAVLDYCAIAVRGEVECFHVLYLDRKNRLISDVRVSVGTVDHVPVYPREVLKCALLMNAFDPEAETALAGVLGRGRTPIIVALDGRIAGIFGLSDQPRPSAKGAIARLRDIGVSRIAMLTGDQPQAAQAIAAEIGIDEVHAGLMPEDKLDLICRFQAEGRHVAMIGDGINDAPALAAADTSIAMGAAGSDVAIETADIALMADDLEKLPEAMAISRATLRNMRQNLVIALLTVAGLLFGVFNGDVHMAEGMLIHQLSVLVVIANAMRLLRVPRGPGGRRAAQATLPATA